MYREHAGGSDSTFAKVGSRSVPTSQRWLDGPHVRTVPADKSRNPPHVRRPGAAESGREATRVPVSQAGRWRADSCVKEAYIRRTGLMRSDQTTVRSRWRRIGNYLQLTTILYDPVYLAEPYIRSSMMYVYDPAMRMDPYPCEEATETAVPRGAVPHFLPGRSPLPGLNPKLTDRFRTPYEPRLGGPETMYPEYTAKIKTFPVPATVGRESD